MSGNHDKGDGDFFYGVFVGIAIAVVAGIVRVLVGR